MLCLLLSIFAIQVASAAHFNGGTIGWAPIYPFDNSTSITISIIQSYYWTYPTITCAANVPISTAGRSSQNANLTCVVDCSTDGGYSMRPISILTDCVSASLALAMMTSERSVNVTLNAGAHFYLAYVGSAWRSLGSPAVSALQWSILTSIDLRKRPDGFINTSPVVSIASPQYAVVNRTTQIQIPVSDANAGDTVRCRWAKFVPGYRRRKRSSGSDFFGEGDPEDGHKKRTERMNMSLIREKRQKSTSCSTCTTTCKKDCLCTCAGCTGTTCTGLRCTSTICPMADSTTTETPGILLSTSSYPSRQAIDECGGICYPALLPSNTTLANCTLSFRGLVAGIWYPIAIQVTDSPTLTHHIRH
jgi:hypothetical protein